MKNSIHVFKDPLFIEAGAKPQENVLGLKKHTYIFPQLVNFGLKVYINMLFEKKS
jgi:hypothetical protein